VAAQLSAKMRAMRPEMPAPVPARVFVDARGKLSFGELGGSLPFAPARYFLVYDVPVGKSRGGHAHRSCEQYMIAVSGSVRVTLDDGLSRNEHVLDRPDLGLHVPAWIWGEQNYLTEDARLLVLASEPYDLVDYIADYQQFLTLKAQQ
jgi:UDP-2-acetamido-3-amino-2,3-dideoxy-glucuronate N-acetyltransferase